MFSKLLFPLFLVFSSLLACADEFSTKGREILEKHGPAVITVQVLLKVSYSGSSTPSETKEDITGTVLDSSGLTVLALSACDPSELYQRVLSDEYSRAKVQTEVTDIKILLEDGTEVPCEIVLRDKDLDLAFIRPKTKPATSLPFVDLTKSGPAQALDQLLALYRLNGAAGRSCAGAMERVSAVIKKPRTLYIPESSMTGTTRGAPAFSLDGNVVGIFVARAISAKSASSRGYRNSVTAVILPAEDILKAARQAPEPRTQSEKPVESSAPK
jgi:serine protease Do